MSSAQDGVVDSPPGRTWTRSDRRNLIVWLIIGTGLPAVIALLTGRLGAPHGAVWTLQSELLTKGAFAFFVCFATWVVSRLENRPLDDYAVPPRSAFGLRFWEGSIWGFAALSALALLLRALGYFRFDQAGLKGRTLAVYSVGWALAFLCVGISEEFQFRSYLLFIASGRIGFWRAALALSIGFAVAHLPNPGETVIGIAQVFAIGMLFCLTIRRTGNLWFAVGFHAAWDWAETFFYGTPDSGLIGQGHFLSTFFKGPSWISGGSAGPEGSVFVLLLLAACAFLVHVRFPKVTYPDRPL